MMHAEELKALGADVVLSTDHGDDVVTLIREITGDSSLCMVTNLKFRAYARLGAKT